MVQARLCGVFLAGSWREKEKETECLFVEMPCCKRSSEFARVRRTLRFFTIRGVSIRPSVHPILPPFSVSVFGQEQPAGPTLHRELSVETS